MVIGAEVGIGSHVGVLVLQLRVPVVLLVSYVVHAAVFVCFTIGVYHQTVVLDTRVALFLPVTFLVAVVADNVQFPGAVVAGWPIVASGPS
jgi:hypothetical protein